MYGGCRTIMQSSICIFTRITRITRITESSTNSEQDTASRQSYTSKAADRDDTGSLGT